ncbi:MAG: hypothetical protein H7Z21_09340 [Hymenobacter sp.]|nr:hypothetical protein [Hymenobacter sp.]
MKHLFNIFPKLTAIAAMALSISSCNRAEYAMLPKTTPYHATYGTIKSAPAPAGAPEEMTGTSAPAAAAPEKNTALTTPAATTPAAPATASAKTPAAVAPVAAPRKLSLARKLAAAKVLKQVDKAASKLQLKKHTETADTKKLDGKLRQGIILILVGLLLEILGAATGLSIIYILGAIVAIIGVILIVLYLLDEL